MLQWLYQKLSLLLFSRTHSNNLDHLPEYPPFPLDPISYPVHPRYDHQYPNVRTGEDIKDWRPLQIEEVFKLHEGQELHRIADAHGREFQCILPSFSTNSTDLIMPQDSRLVEEGEAAFEQRWSLLEGLSVGHGHNCLYHVDGPWTYEYCHGRGLRQYQLDSTIKQNSDSPDSLVMGLLMRSGVVKTKLDYSLGKLQGRKWWDRDHQEIVLELEFGDFCPSRLPMEEDPEMATRSAIVRFRCDSQRRVDHIAEVHETETCRYNVVIGTGRLCGLVDLHPSFLERLPRRLSCYPLQVPLNEYSDPKDEAITNDPVLSRTLYRLYLERLQSILKAFGTRSEQDDETRLLIKLLLEDHHDRQHEAAKRHHQGHPELASAEIELPAQVIAKWFDLLDLKDLKAMAEDELGQKREEKKQSESEKDEL